MDARFIKHFLGLDETLVVEVKKVPLSMFLGLHVIELQIIERDPDFKGTDKQFYAAFAGYETRASLNITRSPTGNGRTPLRAVNDLIKETAGKIIFTSGLRIPAHARVPHRLFVDDLSKRAIGLPHGKGKQ